MNINLHAIFSFRSPLALKRRIHILNLKAFTLVNSSKVKTSLTSFPGSPLFPSNPDFPWRIRKDSDYYFKNRLSFFIMWDVSISDTQKWKNTMCETQTLIVRRVHTGVPGNPGIPAIPIRPWSPFSPFCSHKHT